MEALFIRILFMLLGIRTIVSTAILETKALKEVSELKKFFIDKIHEIKNRYEEKLEALQDETTRNNEKSLKSIDELNVKLENELKEKSDAIRQLKKDFLEKETQLTTEIKDLKNQLLTERNEKESKDLKESMSERKTGLDIPKGKGDTVSGASTTKINQDEDETRNDEHVQDKEATGAGSSIIN